MTATPAPPSTLTRCRAVHQLVPRDPEPARTESSFWTAMKNRLVTGSNGPRMTGPAAADYILASYPGLV